MTKTWHQTTVRKNTTSTGSAVGSKDGTESLYCLVLSLSLSLSPPLSLSLSVSFLSFLSFLLGLLVIKSSVIGSTACVAVLQATIISSKNAFAEVIFRCVLCLLFIHSSSDYIEF